MSKCYSELIKLPTFEERFEYLKLDGVVGKATFGFDRYLNQLLYRSKEWQFTRRDILIRDGSCDLGVEGREIFGSYLLHHINPISIEEVEGGDPILFDPENLICTTFNTHNAIHYGDKSILITLPKARTKGDTCLWKAF